MFSPPRQANQKVKEVFNQYAQIEVNIRRVQYTGSLYLCIWPRYGAARVLHCIFYELLKTAIKNLNRKYTIKWMCSLISHSNLILMGQSGQPAKDTYFSESLAI